jgi:microcystin-dependent protein
MECFVGTILLCAFNYAPNGWMLCNGQSLLISQYVALYSLIGTKYGGDGVKNFNLPDLRGRFPVGMGQSPYSGVVACNLGDVHNSTGQVSLVSGNVPLPLHTHSITNTVNCTGGGSVQVSLPINIPVNADTTAALTNVPTNNMLAQGKAGTNVANIYTSSTPTTNATLKSFNAQGSINVPAPTVTVTSTCGAAGGAGAPFDIRPHSLCINYIIAVTGIYPERPPQ